MGYVELMAGRYNTSGHKVVSIDQAHGGSNWSIIRVYCSCGKSVVANNRSRGRARSLVTSRFQQHVKNTATRQRK